MDVMLQRHCARYIYVVPDGLRELMSDISREVLREQPEDMYTFIADYLDALLITRENARVSARFVVSMTDSAETIVDLLDRSGMTRSEADHAAHVIQEAFRNWSTRRGILKEDEDMIVARIIEEAGITEFQAQKAAVCIQHAFQSFKVRKQREQELLSDTVDWRVAARSAIRLYRKTGVSPEEAKKAANTIKAAYKGYYTRRTLQKLNEMQASIPGEEVEDIFEQADEVLSLTSGISDKKKEVRLDYGTILPHVDFGGEELIAKEEDVVEEEDHFEIEDIDELEEDDVMKKIFGQHRRDEPKEPSSDSFIRGILDECLKMVERKTTRRFSARSKPIKEESAEAIRKEEEIVEETIVANDIMEEMQKKLESEHVPEDELVVAEALPPMAEEPEPPEQEAPTEEVQEEPTEEEPPREEPLEEEPPKEEPPEEEPLEEPPEEEVIQELPLEEPPVEEPPVEEQPAEEPPEEQPAEEPPEEQPAEEAPEEPPLEEERKEDEPPEGENKTEKRTSEVTESTVLV